jgi:hypothetical protein
MGQTKQFLSWRRRTTSARSFWAYVNPHRPMTAVEYTDNKPIAVVINALRTGL